MSHITIIISKSASTEQDLAMETSYEFRIPIPHDATPKKVGDMVSRAYRHLEGDLVKPDQAPDSE